MRGNSIGDIFTVTTFGESHGKMMGVVIDGVPAGLNFSLADLKTQLERRRPGRLSVSTDRDEKDEPTIVSGIFNEKTLGTPICVLIENTNQKPEDYEKLETENRPGHADATTIYKFGIRDHRGGGRASGRETVCRVIAGYFASLILPQVNFTAIISELGPYQVKDPKSFLKTNSTLGYADESKDQEIQDYLLGLKSQGESIGGAVFLTISGCPKGLGEPVFDKLKAKLAHAFMSIGSCVGVQLGSQLDIHQLQGSEISKSSHFFGGIEGGISNGENIQFTLFFKAPSTIGEKAKQGRHDPCILPRVLPVVESMAKIIIADQFLKQNAYQINS